MNIYFIEKNMNGLEALQKMFKSLIIRGKQIKTTMSYHCIPISRTNTEPGKDTGQPELTYCWRKAKPYSRFGKQFDSFFVFLFFYQVKHTLTIDAAIPFLDIS